MGDAHRISMDIVALMTSMLDKDDLRAIEGAARLLDALDAFGREELNPGERMELNAAAANVRRTILETQEAASANDHSPVSTTHEVVAYISSYVESREASDTPQMTPGGLTA